MGPRVFAQERHPLGVDPELRGMAADEGEGGAQVVEGVGVPRKATQPIVEREPVEAGPGQRLQELAHEDDPAARSPAAAVDHEHGRAEAAPALDVGIQN